MPHNQHLQSHFHSSYENEIDMWRHPSIAIHHAPTAAELSIVEREQNAERTSLAEVIRLQPE
jgi:hypothetical protein